MPRVSAAALKLESIANTFQRPEPPDTLGEEAAEEWRRVVSRMPAGWFPPETLAILEDRCQQVVWLRLTHRRIAEVVKKKTYDARAYYLLIKLAGTQSRTLAALDTKMRLTKQSTYDKAKPRRSIKPFSPWTDDTKSTEDQDQDEA